MMSTATIGTAPLKAKLAYGNVRFIHEQLVDGGNHDVVVQEISSTWPNEAWQLRQYLMDISPFLSTESLKEAVNKSYFPMAMKAEVCIANPDATKKEGFTKWLELEANEPMPGYLIDLIIASWETRTFRTEMELELADHHATMCYMANEMLYVEHQQAQPSPMVLRSTWQQVRSTAGRYAEALLLMGQGNYSGAFAVIEDMPVDHDLKASQVSEQQRMLSYITLLSNAATNSRDAANLTASEVAQLQGLSAEHYDRPANWISNLLCVYYGECRSPRTGGEFGGDKNRLLGGYPKQDDARDEITLAPNPTQTWSTVTYNLVSEPSDGLITVKDATGRVLLIERMTGKEGQVVLDTRGLAQGVYLVECSSKGVIIQTDRLIVQ
jgi:hypothetical protein